MRKSIVAFAVTAVAVVALSGCGESAGEKGAEALAGKMLGQKVEVEGETVTIGETRMASGADAKVPDDFPEHAYLPGEYTVDMVIANEGSTALHLSTPEPAAKLFADASASLTGQGWTTSGWNIPPGDDGVGMATFEKDGQRVSITVDDRGDEDTLYTVEAGAARK